MTISPCHLPTCLLIWSNCSSFSSPSMFSRTRLVTIWVKSIPTYKKVAVHKENPPTIVVHQSKESWTTPWCTWSVCHRPPSSVFWKSCPEMFSSLNLLLNLFSTGSMNNSWWRLLQRHGKTHFIKCMQWRVLFKRNGVQFVSDAELYKRLSSA